MLFQLKSVEVALSSKFDTDDDFTDDCILYRTIKCDNDKREL